MIMETLWDMPILRLSGSVANSMSTTHMAQVGTTIRHAVLPTFCLPEVLFDCWKYSASSPLQPGI